MKTLKLILLIVMTVGGQAAAQTSSTASSVKTTVKGCLWKGGEGYVLATGDRNYHLIGLVSELEGFNNFQPLIVIGIKNEEPEEEPPNDPVTHLPEPVNLRVTSVKPFKVPEPILRSSFTNPANWTTQTNSEYGIKFSRPRKSTESDKESDNEYTNFASGDEGVMIVAALGISSPFSDSNGGAADYVIRATSKIRNRETCEQFNMYNGNQSSMKTVNGIPYATLMVGSAAMGHWGGDYYFHTFQNRLCYEIAITIHSESTGGYDSGCLTPMLTNQNEDKLVETLIQMVAFIKPSVVIPQPKEGAVPQITSFTASSDVATDPTLSITFSWQSTGTDYVKFSYFCSDLETGFVGIIEGENVPRNCSNSNTTYSDNPASFPANSSHDVSLASYRDEDPRSIVVTLVPFSHGKPNPDLERSITITVLPYNQFPKGIPTTPRNMTLRVVPARDGGDTYAQGTQLTVQWTDTRPDPRINLYLIGDDGHGNVVYHTQINNESERPASAGSFTWTITKRYQGSGFHIFAAAPALASSAVSAPFTIVESQ